MRLIASRRPPLPATDGDKGDRAVTRLYATAVLCLAAAATLPSAAPVRAQTSDTVPSVTVRYGDLDIGSPAGARVLLTRIQAAADTACGRAPDIRRLDRWAYFEACRRSAVTRAVAQVGSPMLTATAHPRSPASFATR
jgi:UrcA family protein